ncbi:hypothetical protein NC796_09245 [Aliifodinibius sp. S!AR15-10]|uniref:hypothetical protein n=1 Tax=Aliifodinibius sp. S!AR15-10 TaxID=2950437 RepID=UPI00285476A7|nr:hypothetical protein [Aliifodinibius sp. S!AR15-10]MDR8391321.1 hypothetical protein [Aliifodinibius sp. S!AR15-10]
MKEKIKQISALGWVAIFLSSISITILIPEMLQYFEVGNTVEPWRNAYRVSTAIAIEIFSEGTPGEIVYTKERLSALAGIIILFIIGPGLFLLCGLNGNDEPTDSNSFIGFVSGLIITISALFMMSVEVGMYTFIYDNSKVSASRSSKTDEIRLNLSTLATESYQYLVLPEEQGGGGGSFEDLHIENLPSYSELEPGSYRFGESPSDTLLRIIGSDKPDYTAGDEQAEEVTLIVNVQPSDILHWKKNR